MQPGKHHADRKRREAWQRRLALGLSREMWQWTGIIWSLRYRGKPFKPGEFEHHCSSPWQVEGPSASMADCKAHYTCWPREIEKPSHMQHICEFEDRKNAQRCQRSVSSTRYRRSSLPAIAVLGSILFVSKDSWVASHPETVDRRTS